MLRVYWRVVLRPQFKRMLLIAGSALLAAIAEIASLGLIIPVINLFSDQDAAAANPVVQAVEAGLLALGYSATQQAILLGLLVSMGLLVLARNVLVVINGYIVEAACAKIYQQLIRQLFQAYLAAE